MATRRSRLQVKPNIGGPKTGPKAPPPLKIPDTSPRKSEGDYRRGSSPIKSPKVSSPLKSPRLTSPVKSPRLSSPVKSPRVTAPLKGPRVPYPLRGNSPVKDASEEVSQDVVSSLPESSVLQSKQSYNSTGKTAAVKDHDENVTKGINSPENNKGDSEKTDKTTEKSTPAPARARLRRFGTVNVASSRSVRTGGEKNKEGEAPAESQPDKGDTTLQGNVKLDNSGEEHTVTAGKIKESREKDTLETSDRPKYGDSSVETSYTAEENKAESGISKPKPVVRARLPKAKPNLQDAGRKRPKPVQEDSESTADNSSESLSTLPPSTSQSTTTDGSNTDITSGIPNSTDSSPVKHTSIQARPTLPRSPQKSFVSHPLIASPVKAGGKMMVGEKDKWARTRTISASEGYLQPPPTKRAKKPKITAPTDKPPDRATMRMRDLIHWNPSSNPMKVKEKKIAEVNETTTEKENEKTLDAGDNDMAEEEEEMPVPQVTVGPDGNIVINEKSLVVKNTKDDKGATDMTEIIDETEMFTTYGTFRCIKRSKRWSEKETAKFYKALAMVGIDFFLIQKMMPNRERFELKKKFKTEERKNSQLIERVLRERLHFDDSIFENHNSGDEEEEERKGKGNKKGRQKGEKEDRKKKVTRIKKKKDGSQKGPRLRMNRRNNNMFYYDSSTDSEQERELEKNFQENPDSPRQSAGVSKTGKDQEVVGILMDMSEGRLPTSTAAENIQQTQANSVLINQSYVDDTVTVNPASDQNELLTNLQQQIPGLQNIITVEVTPDQRLGPQPLIAQNGLTVMAAAYGLPQAPDIAYIDDMNSPYQTNEQVVMINPDQNSASIASQNILNNDISVDIETVTEVANDIHLITEEMENVETIAEVQDSTETGPAEIKAEEEVAQTAGSQAQNVMVTPAPSFNPGQVISQQILSSEVVSQFSGLPPGGPNDQYVLVTVMPESGQETVIHVYRLHGAVQTRELIAEI